MRALILLLALSLTSLGQWTAGPFVIVTRDSVALRDAPSASARATRFAHATLQLAVLASSADSVWYLVKIGEDKGYQLRHNERVWVHRSDVAESRASQADATVDIVLLEEPVGHFGHRMTPQEFMSRSAAVPDSFYVSAVYRAHTPTPSCLSPFSVCARTYRPGHYFIGPGGHPEAARSSFERLYGAGTVRARYELSASATMHTVREKLVLARILMRQAGCYAEDYVGTELIVLRDTVRHVHARRASYTVPVASEHLFHDSARGEVQYVNLMWLLEPTYADSRRDTILRRIMLWWPKCM